MTGISNLWADSFLTANNFSLQTPLVVNASFSVEFGDGPMLLLDVQKKVLSFSWTGHQNGLSKTVTTLQNCEKTPEMNDKS